MMAELLELANFIDLGGTFILAMGLLYLFFNRLGGINDKLSKLLALMTVLVRQNTDFNHVKRVLNSDVDKVEEALGSEIDKL